MIKINGKSYDASVVIALDGSMSLTFNGTTETIGKIETLLNTSPKIEVYENDALIATYYAKQMISLSAKKTNELYTITAVLRASKVEPNAEEEINGRIDTSDGAVEELGVMASDHEGRITTLEEQVAALMAGSATEETATEETEAETETETEANNG